MKHLLYTTAILALLFASGCKDIFPPQPKNTSFKDPNLVGKQWYLVSFTSDSTSANGVIKGRVTWLPNTVNGTITFNADFSVGGFGGCNTFAAKYTNDSSRNLKITSMQSTLTSCSNAQYETQYFAALPQAYTYMIQSDTLRIYCKGTTNVLTYAGRKDSAGNGGGGGGTVKGDIVYYSMLPSNRGDNDIQISVIPKGTNTPNQIYRGNDSMIYMAQAYGGVVCYQAADKQTGILNVYAQPLDGSTRRLVATDVAAYALGVTTDGKWFAVVEKGDVVMRSTYDGNLRGRYSLPQNTTNPTAIAFAPGSMDVFALTCNHVINGSYFGCLVLYDVYPAANAPGMRIVQDSVVYPSLGGIDWSPDGKKIATTTNGGTQNSIPGTVGFLMPRAITIFDVSNKTATPAITVQHFKESISNSIVGCPRWSPDGSKIAFTRGTEYVWNTVDAVICNLNSTQQSVYNVSGNSHVNYIDWSSDGMSLLYGQFGSFSELKPHLGMVDFKKGFTVILQSSAVGSAGTIYGYYSK